MDLNFVFFFIAVVKIPIAPDIWEMTYDFKPDYGGLILQSKHNYVSDSDTY